MKLPFFKKKIEITVSKEKTTFGLVNDNPITMNTFKTLEEKHNEFYRERYEKNKKILEGKLAASKIWLAYVSEIIDDIPTKYIPIISIVQDERNDLDSIVHPSVYLKFHIDYGNDKIVEKQYDVYALEHENSETSILKLLGDIRELKKNIKSLESKDK